MVDWKFAGRWYDQKKPLREDIVWALFQLNKKHIDLIDKIDKELSEETKQTYFDFQRETRIEINSYIFWGGLLILAIIILAQIF